MSIQEILRKQAESVKANSNKIIEAQKYEAVAAKLRAEANAPVKMDFAARVMEKRAKGERIMQAYRNSKKQTAPTAKPVSTTFKTENKKQTPAEALKRIKAVFDAVEGKKQGL